LSTSPATQSTALFKQGLEAEAAGDYWAALTRFTNALATLGTDGSPAEQATIWTRIGYVLIRARQYRQAAEALEFAQQLDARKNDTQYGLAIAYFYLGRTDDACNLIEQAAKRHPDDPVIALERANILSIVHPDPQKKLALYRDWGQRFADPLITQTKPFDLDRSLMRPLKVGYVSGDMREHSVAFFLEPIFARHLPQCVETFVFSTSKQKDAVTARLKKHINHWFDVSSMNDDALFNLIRKHKIDILVDLSGHTHGHRLYVFARRAAPIQVTWLGYMGGTIGMQAMDYRLTDGGINPPGQDIYYVEKLFRMKCIASYTPPNDVPLSEQPPMLTNAAPPMLVSLNSSKKITDEMLLIWKEILVKRTDATLLIHVQEESTEDAVATMQPRLERLKLPIDRVLVSPMVPLHEFMQRGTITDIALDTAPISGGTTTLHALWMGLPVIALDGEEAVAASTARTLQGLGLDHMVAKTPQEYIDKVINLIDHPELLVAHRKSIRNIMKSSVLMDYDERREGVEKAYRLMWFNYLLGEFRYKHTNYAIQSRQLPIVEAELRARNISK